LTDIQLRIAAEHTDVQVTYDPVEAATEQFKPQEKQRVFGIVPNFYVSYDRNAEPLTTKMKFKLALKVSVDPVMVAGVALVSGAKQASNSSHYGQGAEGYGKRFGATAADGFSDIMIGGAILPSLLHQDPRYFYQGTGTASSRIRPTPPRQVFRGWICEFTVDAHDNIFILKGKADLNGEVWKVKWDGSGLPRVSGTLPLIANVNYTHTFVGNQIDVSPDAHYVVFQSQQVLQENIGIIDNVQ
jgi:hypothetical protein